MVRQPGLARVIDRLEEAGHRATPPRLAVLAATAGEGDQFTAEEIARALPRVGRATVFRTLKLLVEVGVLCRVLLDDGTLRYRWSPSGHHHHLVCTTCGSVQDFTACDVPELVRGLATRAGFAVEGHWLDVYGRCSACVSDGAAAGEAEGAGAVPLS